MEQFNTKSVWKSNYYQELQRLNSCMDVFPIISVDTEFPGFLFNTPRDAPEDERYLHVKDNVDRLKLLQLGVALSDHSGNIGGTWEFNFHYDSDHDLYQKKSLDFLTKSGMNFKRLKEDGIDIAMFRVEFGRILRKHMYTNPNVEWVTFHGLYDIAYMLKMLTGQPLPDTQQEFIMAVRMFFHRVTDIKLMAGYYYGHEIGLLGLEKLAKLLGVKRMGCSHHAGSDSLVTGCIFYVMKNLNSNIWQHLQHNCEGYLYGISARITSYNHGMCQLTYLPQFYGQFPVCYPVPFSVNSFKP